MVETRDWGRNRDLWIRLLEKQTGQGVDWWNHRIRKAHLDDEQGLRSWLAAQGVTGYARTLLVMERFGYPDFFLATAAQLIDGQYTDRPQLRPAFDAILAAAMGLGQVTIQERKTYVSLLSPRRTFARLQPTTRTRLDLGLRLERQPLAGRLQPSRIHPTMPLQISLAGPDEVDSELLYWLRQAYDQNL